IRKFYLAGVLSGFIGGLLGAYVLAHLDEHVGTGVDLAAAPTATQQEFVSARRIRLIDATGMARAELAMSPDGGPGIFFYDTKGRNRLELGLYSPAEGEYPFVVLNDTQQRAAGIFRLYGGGQPPVGVLKNQGGGRSLYRPQPTSTQTFFVHLSPAGTKTTPLHRFTTPPNS